MAPTPHLTLQRSAESPFGGPAAPVLCLNDKVILKTHMREEKRRGDVVEPYAMNWNPFLEDIAVRDTTRPSSVMAEGGKSLPYDPPMFPTLDLSKGDREKNKGLILEQRERMRRGREAAMKAKADRIEESRRIKGSQPKNVEPALATFFQQARFMPESLALTPTVHLPQMGLDLPEVESEEEGEGSPQTLPLVVNSLSVLDELSMSELGTPGLVLPVPVQQSEVLLSDILAEEVIEVPRFRTRIGVQTEVPPPMPAWDSNEMGTVLMMHKLSSEKYIPVSSASIKYFCRKSEDFRTAWDSMSGDMKKLQRKFKSWEVEWGMQMEDKIQWWHVPRPEFIWNHAQKKFVSQSRSDAELFLQEYLRKVNGFGIADIEVFLQCDLNFRENFLAWLPLEPLIPKNILRRLETLISPKYIPKAVAQELREMWACGQEVNKTSVDETCAALPRFKCVWDSFVTSQGDVVKAIERFRSSMRANH